MTGGDPLSQSFRYVSRSKLCIIVAITSVAPYVSPDTFAAALDAISNVIYKNGEKRKFVIIFSLSCNSFQKKRGFGCNPGIDGGVEQKNIEFQFFCVFCLVNCILLPRLLLWLLK